MMHLLLLLAVLPLAASKTPAQLITDFNRSGLPGKTRALQSILALNPSDVPDSEFEQVAKIIRTLQQAGSSIISGISLSPAWKAALAKAQSAQAGATESLAARDTKEGKARDAKYAAAGKPTPVPKAKRLPEDFAKALEKSHGADSEKMILGHIAQHPEVVDMVDDEDNSPLMLALMNDKPSLPVIRELIKRTKNVDHRDDHGETALMTAAREGVAEAVKLLVERGADVNAQNDFGLTPLIEATSSQNPEIIQFLLNNKASINARDNDGYSALHSAIAWDLYPKLEGELCENCGIQHKAAPSPAQQVKTIQTLLNHGADIESKTTVTLDTPLIRAVQMGNVPVVKILLTNKADTEARNQYGYTPLFSAIVSRRATWSDIPPEQERANHEIILQIIKLLLETRANPNAIDDAGWSALQWAVRNEDAPVVRELIVHGAQNKATRLGYQTPLEEALQRQKNRPADDSPEKRRAIDEIIDMLLHTKELIADYRASQSEQRSGQRALAQHVRSQKLPEISEVIGEFLVEPKVKPGKLAESVALINKIKVAIRRNDTKTLLDLFTSDPDTLEVTDNDGNTPLLLSLHYHEHSPYLPATASALNVIIAALRAADVAEEGKNERLQRALAHRNRQDLNALALARALGLPKNTIAYLEEQGGAVGK